MNLTYMTHPLHGVHIAYDAAEIARNEAHGWKVHGPNPPGMTVVKADSFPAEEVKKRGRPRKAE